MTSTTTGIFNSQVDAFNRLSVDEQLGLFWVIYTAMGSSITPAAPGASTVSPTIAQGLFDQVKALSYEEQFQVMRDLINRKSTLITREYGALSDTTKLLFWYLLAQGMDNSTIIPVPEDYKISSEAQDLFNEIAALEFSEQITLLRDIVAPMGVDATSGGVDKATGL